MRENFVQPLGMSFQSNQEMQGRGSEKEIHHEAISHGNAKSSHESNASNGVQFGAETKKLWPIQGNCAKLKRNFALTFPDAKIFALIFPDAKIFALTFPNEKIFGRLVKIKNPHETELELEVEVMEAIPEDQHSQHAPTENLNAYRSMRDRMHPPTLFGSNHAPSCIVPPIEQLVIRPHIVPLLPIFHGMDCENPYQHIKEFEETDLQAEFLKKFFPTHKTNGLKRQISNFSAKENEKFYECWERYMEAINACPHHGFDTWLLVLIRKQTLQLWQEEDWRNLKSPPQASSLEQAILNLNKVVGDFVADQKSINDQFMQVNAHIRQEMANRDRMMDGKHNDLSQKIDNLRYQISRLTNLNTARERKISFSTSSNPKVIHEQEPETKAKKEKREENKIKKKGSSTKKENLEAKVKEKPERTINQEEVIKKHMPPPFPQALHGSDYYSKVLFHSL
ncbi:hypothetical protein AAG906_013663 [Vitis piasezkii]